MQGRDLSQPRRRAWLTALPLTLAALLVVQLWRLHDPALDRAIGLGLERPLIAADVFLRSEAAPRLQTLSVIFLGIYFEALPLLLLGVFASALTAVFLSPDRLQRMLPRGAPALFVGACLGMVFPVCECGQVPVARRLLQKGAPTPVVLAFTLAAPVVNPIVILSTWYAFQWDPRVVVLRVALTVAVAMGVAALVGRASTGVVLPQVLARHEHAQAGPPWQRVLGHASAEFLEMSRYFILGSLLAALAQTLIPQSLLLEVGQNAATSVLVMLALAVMLSVCSTVDAFIALSFVNTFALGGVLTFLVFGPMVDVKSTLMFGTTFRARAIAAIVALCAALTAAIGIAINVVLR